MDVQVFQALESLRQNGVSAASAAPGPSGFESLLQGAAVKSPATMDDLFQRASDAYGISLKLLKAVAKAESNFDSDAVSGCGAIGVMQLMPGTARSLGVADPYDAEQNIMGGAKYLRQMLDQFDGDVELALAGYNAGPGAVRKYGGIPPYTETQTYVKRVLGYAGQDLGAVGALPSSSRKSPAADLGSTTYGDILSALAASDTKTTTPAEAAQLYKVLSALINPQLNSGLNRALFSDDEDAALDPLRQSLGVFLL